MGEAVHRPDLSGDRLAEAKSSWFGVVTALGVVVHRPSLFGDRLDMVESSATMGLSPDTAVFTDMGTAVHHHCLSGATALFHLRVANWIYSRGGHRHGHRHGCGGAPP